MNEQPTSKQDINAETPALTEYTDVLIGLSQWPDVSSYWTIAPSDARNFLLLTTLSFDSLPYSKPPGDKLDIWIERAESAVAIYEKLLTQLTDPNGISIQFKTNLLTQPSVVSTEDINALIEWLDKIKCFIADCLQGNFTSSESLQKVFTLNGKSCKTDVNSAQIFALDFEFIISRNSITQDDVVMPAIRHVATQITPKTDNAAANGIVKNKPVLDQFAKNIEDILSEPGKFTLTVATGEERLKANAGESNSTVWGIRLGENSVNAISFSINDYDKNTHKGTPQIFAPRPVSNRLESRSGVTVHDYSSIDNFDSQTNTLIGVEHSLTFSDIDLGVWVSELFTSIDKLLSPEYLASIFVIDNISSSHPAGVTSFAESFNMQKKALANVAKKLISPVYKIQESSLIDSAQEALYQKLLDKLSNLYSTNTAISYSATVRADESTEPPLLHGNIVFNSDAEKNNQIMLSASTLKLKTSEQLPLTFLVEMPVLNSASSITPGILSVDINFNGRSIEHQITDVSGVKTSTLLSIVRGETAKKLQTRLGMFDIPIFKHAFPASPNMIDQSGAFFTETPASVDELISWQYSFTYSQHDYCAQDIVYGEIEYNLKPTHSLQARHDAFQPLAQFIAAKNTLEKLLKETISRISAKTDDLTKINDAAKVLGAYLKIISNVATVSERVGCFCHQSLSALLANTELTYAFHIEDGEYDIAGGTWVVKIVSANEVPPSGLLSGQRPYIDIPGAGITRIEIPDNDSKAGTDWSKGKYAYRYLVDDKPLTGDKAQEIGARTVVIPGINILNRQNAKSTIFLKRKDELVKDHLIADEFIYQTPRVTFNNLLLPTIDQFEPFNIASLNEGQIPLTERLNAFFKTLFKNSVNDTQTIKLECQYSFSLIDGFDTVRLPVVLIRPTSINLEKDFTVLEDGEQAVNANEDTPTFVGSLSNGILNWLTQNDPNRTNGKFYFDFTVMSDLTDQPITLVRLRDLYLKIEDVSA